MVEDRGHYMSITKRHFGGKFRYTIEALNEMQGPIPAVAGLEYVGNSLLNDGIANFIQIKIDKDPFNESYFRAGIKPHNILLEDFLKETGIDNKDQCKIMGGGIIGEKRIPPARRYNREIYNAGRLIQQKPFIDAYFVSSFKNGKILIPDMMQLNKVSRDINKPIEYFENYDAYREPIKIRTRIISPGDVDVNIDPEGLEPDPVYSRNDSDDQDA